MKHVNFLVGVYTLLFLGAVRSACAQELTSATITFKTTPEGKFRARVKTDILMQGDCLVELFGRRVIQADPDAEEFGGVIPLGAITDSTEDLAEFTASKLPAVLNVNGFVPKLHLQARVTCGESTVTTDVFARFITCGKGKKESGEKTSRVSIDRWMEVLADKLTR